jgi:hypothetical protein
MRWTQEQRDKAHEVQQVIGRAIHFSNVKLTQPLEHELLDELACQRNELLEALKTVAELLPSKNTIEALMPDCGLGRRHYPLSHGLLDSDIVRILDAIEKVCS